MELQIYWWHFLFGLIYISMFRYVKNKDTNVVFKIPNQLQMSLHFSINPLNYDEGFLFIYFKTN